MMTRSIRIITTVVNRIIIMDIVCIISYTLDGGLVGVVVGHEASLAVQYLARVRTHRMYHCLSTN